MMCCPLAFMSSGVGLAIPSRPLITSFQPNGPGRYVVEVANPGTVPDFCVFLTQPLPQVDMGISVYYGVEGNWQFLGAVHNQKPTVFIRTGWPLNHDLAKQPSVLVGLALEPASEILQKLDTAAGDNVQKLFAKKVALNLFRFLESFNIPGFPVQALDRWYSKFEEKYNIDPSFIVFVVFNSADDFVVLLVFVWGVHGGLHTAGCILAGGGAAGVKPLAGNTQAGSGGGGVREAAGGEAGRGVPLLLGAGAQGPAGGRRARGVSAGDRPAFEPTEARLPYRLALEAGGHDRSHILSVVLDNAEKFPIPHTLNILSKNIQGGQDFFRTLPRDTRFARLVSRVRISDLPTRSLTQLFQVLRISGDVEVKGRLFEVAEEIGNREPTSEMLEIFDYLPKSFQTKLLATLAGRAELEILKKFPIHRFPELQATVKKRLPTLLVPELLEWLEISRDISDLALECLRLCDLEADALGESEISRVLQIAAHVKFAADQKFLDTVSDNFLFEPKVVLKNILHLTRKRKFVDLNLAVVLDDLDVLDEKTLFRVESSISRRPELLDELDDRKFVRLLQIFTARPALFDRFRQSLGLVLGGALVSRISKFETAALLDCLRRLGRLFQRKLRPALATIASEVISRKPDVESEISCLKLYVKFQLGQVSRAPLEFLIDRLASQVDNLGLEQVASLLEAQCEVDYADQAQSVADRLEALVDETTLSVSRRVTLLFSLADLGLEVDRSTVAALLDGVDPHQLPVPLKSRLLFASARLPVHCLSSEQRNAIQAALVTALLGEEDLGKDRKSLLIIDAVRDVVDPRLGELVDSVISGQAAGHQLLIEGFKEKRALSVDDMMSVVLSSRYQKIH